MAQADACASERYNPDRDLNDATAMVAAKIVKELTARVL